MKKQYTKLPRRFIEKMNDMAGECHGGGGGAGHCS